MAKIAGEIIISRPAEAVFGFTLTSGMSRDTTRG